MSSILDNITIQQLDPKNIWFDVQTSVISATGAKIALFYDESAILDISNCSRVPDWNHVDSQLAPLKGAKNTTQQQQQQIARTILLGKSGCCWIIPCMDEHLLYFFYIDIY